MLFLWLFLWVIVFWTINSILFGICLGWYNQTEEQRANDGIIAQTIMLPLRVIFWLAGKNSVRGKNED